MGLVILILFCSAGVIPFLKDTIQSHRNPPKEDTFRYRCRWAATIIFIVFVGGCLIGIAVTG